MRRIRTLKWAYPHPSGRDRDCRNAVIRGNRQELRLELITLADVDGDDPVTESALFQKDRDEYRRLRDKVFNIEDGIHVNAFC